MRSGLERRLATGVNAVLVGVLVVAVTATLVVLAERIRTRFDLSEDGASTLSPETVAGLSRLDGSGEWVRVTAFSSQRKDAESSERDRFVRDLLRELDLRSTGLSTRFVDFDRDRLLAESLGVSRYGTVVVEGKDDRVDVIDRELFRHSGKGKERRLEFVGEAPIAAALEQVLARHVTRLYSLKGHGEHELFDRGLGEWKALSSLIDGQGFSFRTIDLLRDADDGAAPTVPEDADAVILLGPRAPLAASEDVALRDYLARGGSVGFFVDPGGAIPTLLADVGVVVPDGVVLDREVIYPFTDRPLLRYRSHAITAPLVADEAATVVARAAPLALSTIDGVTASPLLGTGRTGWIERGDLRAPVYDPGVDGEGPVDVAVALQIQRPHPLVRHAPSARILVVGDSDIASDEVLAEGPGNPTFVSNSLRWLARADERMGKVGRPTRVRRIALTPEQLVVVQAAAVGGPAGLALLFGLSLLWARRAM
jgi:hypothetical protein